MDRVYLPVELDGRLFLFHHFANAHVENELSMIKWEVGFIWRIELILDLIHHRFSISRQIHPDNGQWVYDLLKGVYICRRLLKCDFGAVNAEFVHS